MGPARADSSVTPSFCGAIQLESISRRRRSASLPAVPAFFFAWSIFTARAEGE